MSCVSSGCESRSGKRGLFCRLLSVADLPGDLGTWYMAHCVIGFKGVPPKHDWGCILISDMVMVMFDKKEVGGKCRLVIVVASSLDYRYEYGG